VFAGDGLGGLVDVGRQQFADKLALPGVVVQATPDPANHAAGNKPGQHDANRAAGRDVADILAREGPALAHPLNLLFYLFP
jgi:hypothetical protein